jgi:3-phosphoshikimate 1-carboxyvinyltransferase
MTKTLHPVQSVNGNIVVPSSKSVAQRVLACALLNTGTTTILGLSHSDDERAAQEIIVAAGAILEEKEGCLVVHSHGFCPDQPLTVHCGESGLSSRMFTPILANSSFPVSLTGQGSLLQRPMTFFDELAPLLSVNFSSTNGQLPIQFTGPLRPLSYTVDGSLSSQFITGLIYGYVSSPLLTNEVLTIQNPVSIPYIELSLDVLAQFGVVLHMEKTHIAFNGPYQLKGDRTITIEGDWSSASYFLVAAAIFGEITLHNLSSTSRQADSAIITALNDFGAIITQNERSVNIVSSQRKSFTFDATHCPDLFPALAVLGAYGTEKSTIKGVHRLLHKESNRAEAIQQEFSKFGVTITIEGDAMHIFPAQELRGAQIQPHNDHRIAMGAAILALGAQSPTQIAQPEVVNKSFPTFFEVLESVTQM